METLGKEMERSKEAELNSSVSEGTGIQETIEKVPLKIRWIPK